jgi:hypothetical protein
MTWQLIIVVGAIVLAYEVLGEKITHWHLSPTAHPAKKRIAAIILVSILVFMIWGLVALLVVAYQQWASGELAD